MTRPEPDENLVQQLADLAAKLDGGDEVADRQLLDEFNRLAGTSIPFSEFQGIYGAEEHSIYVRRVLVAKETKPAAKLDRDGLITMFAKVLSDPSDDAYLTYVFKTIEKTFGDTQVSDLVFWPGQYFGDGDNSRELTPEMMADAVLDRHAKGAS